VKKHPALIPALGMLFIKMMKKWLEEILIYVFLVIPVCLHVHLGPFIVRQPLILPTIVIIA